MKIIKRKWDSDFFQLNIGELFLSSDDFTSINSDQFDLIYLMSKEDIQVHIPYFKETYSEIQLCFIKDVISPTDYVNEKISSVSNSDRTVRDILYDLAFESGKYSRFRLDSNFAADNFRNLYKKWIDNSLDSDLADEVLILKSSTSIIGFVTYKIEIDTAHIGLIGVSNSHQGMGVGSQLIAAVENKIVSKNIKILKVKTQFQNLEAAGFYKKLGFRLDKSLYIKHLWKT